MKDDGDQGGSRCDGQGETGRVYYAKQKRKEREDERESDRAESRICCDFFFAHASDTGEATV